VLVIASDVPEGNAMRLSALLWRLTQKLFPDTGTVFNCWRHGSLGRYRLARRSVSITQRSAMRKSWVMRD